ncbi:taurine dioxygenase [Vineibacter terrae]|uniref:Taurine dioxygenase n=1 Tax=Vineibacter terrae TaxID=2586908 RepID=A0A5C8PBW3_9HYPH|nr:TauD/TfdA family dioxygenase [Vineibacter terrae]TXL71292.1 taurine dioxygenase [Vineibacter terrae]
MVDMPDGISIDPVSPALGAEIHGIDLETAADNPVLIAAVRQALLKHKVLFFRDQDISARAHVAFARSFGELEVHPVLRHHPDHAELVLLERGNRRPANENIFHADTTWRETPSMGSILRCVECPPVGGDTIWVNMALAYERLPDRIKSVCDGLYAMHDIAHAFGGDDTVEKRRALSGEFPAQEHPVIAVHPETGEKILNVNQGFTTHFTNYTQKRERSIGADFALAANSLMNYLFSQAAQPEFQVRLRWKPNTIAFWDNRATQHYAVQDYYPATRRMARATIIGDRVRGVQDSQDDRIRVAAARGAP